MLPIVVVMPLHQPAKHKSSFHSPLKDKANTQCNPFRTCNGHWLCFYSPELAQCVKTTISKSVSLITGFWKTRLGSLAYRVFGTSQASSEFLGWAPSGSKLRQISITFFILYTRLLPTPAHKDYLYVVYHVLAGYWGANFGCSFHSSVAWIWK